MDAEKDPRSMAPVPADDASSVSSYNWSRKLRNIGVEERGISPVPIEERTDTRLYQIFFLWFSWNFNILSFSAGTLGPFIFNLGLRDSCLVILFFNLLCAAPPAYFCTWGPKSGLRQMVASRYSFGYWPIIIVSILNVTVMCGFTVLNCILGGQTLAAISGDTLSWTVGIVIIAVVSLLVSFCGIKAVTWYERLAWIPVFITIIIALGVGGKHFSDPPAAAPATAIDVLSFASTIAGFVITYSPLSSDYTVYFSPNVSSWKLFLYAYVGFLLPIVPLQCLGAAAAVSATAYTPWMEGYEKSNVGGLLLAMLAPTKGFGKFLTVLLSLSVAANVAPTFYSIGFNCQIILPVLSRVPRYFFSLVALAIILPISIVGQHKFTEALTNFLSVIGYWATAYIAVILLEHYVFRRGSFANYDVDAWNSPRRLPLGIAGLGAAVGCFGLVVPSMYQVWFEGPIGKKTGDIGFELAFVLAGLLYLPLRWAELRISGR